MLFLLRYPAAFLGVAVALLVAIVVHSLAQAAVARAFGDRLPAASGRLNPDPRRHFEPFGVIVMLISAIGWNKPVPLQEPRFRGGRTRYLLAVLAGPLANIALGILSLVALRYAVAPAVLASVDPVDGRGLSLGTVLLYELAVVNVAVGVLTLLPIPPLDGARILWLYAPQTPGWRNARYQLEERNIGVAICVLLSLPLFRSAGLLRQIAVAIGEAILAPVATALGFLIGF
ncbi:MAG TPA: site-2 protease family protein [Frankiaceae bacterium]|nr:site-2 protease family protein [Frankiaceae bacterium]